jgi:1-deoxy-D-xylulose-5-phosphate synthase
MVKKFQGPVLLHVVTEKGHGFKPAAEDPTSFHAPAPFSRGNGTVSFKISRSKPPYTQVMREAILRQMRADRRVVVITAAMCQGNMLEPIREEFPERFFDVGICESHAVAFAAGLTKAGLRPIVDIYSTFLQRSYDQIFQELALQNLPVTLLLDRAGLVGPDGPTHHGVFDLTFLRPLPNLTVMAPGDELDAVAMLDFALRHEGPVAVRYPKAAVETISRQAAPMELGRAEVLRAGGDGALIGCGTLVNTCLKAAVGLADEGLEIGVINARFVKPLDTETILHAVRQSPFVVTVEEGALAGGFGSAVLEAAADAGLDASKIRRLGVPDRFVEHGGRDELLAELRLDSQGIAQLCRQLAAGRVGVEVAHD